MPGRIRGVVRVTAEIAATGAAQTVVHGLPTRALQVIVIPQDVPAAAFHFAVDNTKTTDRSITLTVTPAASQTVQSTFRVMAIG